MAYADKVLGDYGSLRNLSPMDKGGSGGRTGRVDAPACGDLMELQLTSERLGRYRRH